MKTIGAKEFRLHMDEVLDRVIAGEEISIKHRFKRPVRLSTDDASDEARAGTANKAAKPIIKPGSRAAMENFLRRVNNRKRASGKPIFDPNKSIKELYHEMLDNDPKYKPPYHG